MTQHINRKIFTPWGDLSAAVKADIAAALKKHGLEVYIPGGFGTSPGVVSIEDDPEFAKMEAKAKGFTTPTGPKEGDQ